jgi:Bifunctional DNA primase/polymerase, N-terminal
MKPLDAALAYAGRGWPVFPCRWEGERRKRPLIEGGFHAATIGEAQTRGWWRRWPGALIGVPTGCAIGAVVLDVGVKDNRANGFDALDVLGFAILPNTPVAHRKRWAAPVFPIAR